MFEAFLSWLVCISKLQQTKKKLLKITKVLYTPYKVSLRSYAPFENTSLKLRPPNARWWPAGSSHPGKKFEGDSTKEHTSQTLIPDWFEEKSNSNSNSIFGRRNCFWWNLPTVSDEIVIYGQLWGSELVDLHELPPGSDPTVLAMDPWTKETNGKRLGIGLFGSPVPIG